MNKPNKWLVLLCTIMCFQFANAQASDKTKRSIGIKTKEIQVYGNCHMTKHSIEKIATGVAGIKSATYNDANGVLTIKYDVFKTGVTDEVQKVIVNAGFSTDKYAASDSSNTNCCCNRHKES